MKNWRCYKSVNMDEALYNRINNAIPNGLQSKALGAIIEEWFDAHADSLPASISTILVLSHVNSCKEKQDGNASHNPEEHP